ncbi:unnamed protein product [Ambrosiozyma monospora]|uniref:Unnamed protein product n=1 Tax=Ambrosiozyma monospora TaxID=43982 RepID=A0ACB5T4E4_AMBMO|nr:unnamed protein product [Ambrosiozyma monospora]
MVINYTGKFVLAPMVRIGELPTRLLALQHGAQLVWTPELIDKKILTLERSINSKLHTIDYCSKKGNKKIPGVTDLVFRTFPEMEKGKLILQMGTADPEIAVQAASIVIQDVDGIDINAGCPKHFSIHAGMGAALLKTPELLCSILKKLVEEVGKPNGKPISVKIRILEDEKSTLELVEKLCLTGISNLTMHCRRREMRNREAPIRDYVKSVKELCLKHGVSFILNGGVQNYQQFVELQKEYGEDCGVMIAEAAETNATCFSKDGPKSWYVVAKEFIRWCVKFNQHPANAKYCLARIIPNPNGKNKIYALVSKSKTLDQMKTILLDQMDDEGNFIETKSEQIDGAC